MNFQLEPFPKNISGLTPSQLADLRKSGLTDETILAAKFHSVPPRLINKILGFNAKINSLLEIPYPGTDFSRYKLFPPLTNREGHSQKYHQPKDSAPRLYVPPGFDCTKKLWPITEGEKKALKATQDGLNCLGLGGIWNFATKNGNGQPELIPDLKNIPWKNKTVEIIPDADFKKNDHVRRAVYRLAQLLEAEGATVFIVELPGALKLDDYLVKYTAADFEKLPRLTCHAKEFEEAAILENRKDNIQTEGTGELTHPDIFRGVAKIFADEYASITEVPREFLFWAFLTCFGSLLSEKITLKSALDIEPRLYLLLVGESADVRKSTALKFAVKFFQAEMPDFNVAQGVQGSAEGLGKALEKAAALLLYVDEFSAIVSKCNAKNSVLLQMLTTMFENTAYENRTKYDIIKIDNGHLAILAASTIETFQKVWTPNFTAIGFDNRLLLIPGKIAREVSIPNRLSLEAEIRIRRAFKEALEKIDTTKTYSLTEEAQGAFDNWYSDLKRRDSIVKKRIDTIALRLLVLFAANEGKEIIDVDIVDRVIAFSEWQIKVREDLAPFDAENDFAEMEEKIRRTLKKKGSIKEWELQNFTNAKRKGLHIYNYALNNLIKNGEVLRQGKVLSLLKSPEAAFTSQSTSQGVNWR